MCQDFYPGSLNELDAPICYNTSITLGFNLFPYGDTSNEYSYQWQKSWNNSNWFDIANSNSSTHITDNLFSDTYYRVLVSSQTNTIATPSIAIYVLPELESGILQQPDEFCMYDDVNLEFSVGASGAEWFWGGFSGFDYQWQLSILENASDAQWEDVGESWNIYTSNLDEGVYYFRCLVTSPYSCGSTITNTISVVVFSDCSPSSIKENSHQELQAKYFNLLGQFTKEKRLSISIYEDGSFEKKYILK